jgi:hypothetical protein
MFSGRAIYVIALLQLTGGAGTTVSCGATGVGKEQRKISDHRLQTIDFLIKCRKAVSRLSRVLSQEFFDITIEKSTASLDNGHFS